ncbi:hypothetical protein Dsin_023649 [Dipteronia sinensis]|uniref:Disease resistance protein At4g27190-like leucine-rich repeats domain-containing protein n=1 Tax=Dipteronia sinensis TaxID=43782 RepID=A0AAE0A4U3_9ROSI|nr:hypothetical protein Dsin_023649 [Dipteronia sinensis]
MIMPIGSCVASDDVEEVGSGHDAHKDLESGAEDGHLIFSSGAAVSSLSIMKRRRGRKSSLLLRKHHMKTRSSSSASDTMLHQKIEVKDKKVWNLEDEIVKVIGRELFPSSTGVTEESRKEDRKDSISFPKLNCLQMENLAKLTRLWSGYYMEFPLLKEFKIVGCPALEAFIFNDKVRVPSLEKMTILHMDNLKMIWHNQLEGGSFSKLKSLEVYNCQKLLTVFPSSIFGIISQSRDLCFSSLQELVVFDCQSLKCLCAASNVANDEYSPKFLFPKLTSMALYKLPQLRSFYPGRHKVEGPVLKRLVLSHCGIHDTDEEGQMQMQQPLFFVEQEHNTYILASYDLIGC